MKLRPLHQTPSKEIIGGHFPKLSLKEKEIKDLIKELLDKDTASDAALELGFIARKVTPKQIIVFLPAVSHLTLLLNDGDKNVTGPAAFALGAIAKKVTPEQIKDFLPAVSPLTLLLNDGDKDVRKLAATVIEIIKRKNTS